MAGWREGSRWKGGRVWRAVLPKPAGLFSRWGGPSTAGSLMANDETKAIG